MTHQHETRGFAAHQAQHEVAHVRRNLRVLFERALHLRLPHGARERHHHHAHQTGDDGADEAGEEPAEDRFTRLERVRRFCCCR